MAKTDFADLATPETAPIGEAELADLQQPDYQVAADGSAYVFNDTTGELGTVNPAELGALGGSVRLATADDLARHNRIADNSGFGSQMLARGESFARGATLGLSGLAADTLAGGAAWLADDGTPRAAGRGIDAGVSEQSAFERGFEEARANRLARQEALGDEGYLWEGLGAVAPTLLSGGASLGARALAATPAAAVERLGAGVAERVAGKLGTGVLATAASKAAGAGVEGAIGGAATAAADVAPDALQDPVGAAEAVAMSGLAGLAIGGLAGGTLGGIEGLARKGENAATALQAQQAKPVLPDQDIPVTAEQVVANEATRPMFSNQIPDPQRGKIQTTLERSEMLHGGYEKRLDEATLKGWNEFNELQALSDQFDQSANIAAKTAANDVAARELAEEPLDFIDDVEYDDSTRFYHASQNPLTEWRGGPDSAANFALATDEKGALNYLPRTVADQDVVPDSYAYNRDQTGRLVKTLNDGQNKARKAGGSYLNYQIVDVPIDRFVDADGAAPDAMVQAIQSGSKLDPVRALYDGQGFKPQAGVEQIAAARAAGKRTVPAIVATNVEPGPGAKPPKFRFTDPGRQGQGYVYEFKLPKGAKLADEKAVLDMAEQLDPASGFSSAWEAIDARPQLRQALAEAGYDGARFGTPEGVETVSVFNPQMAAPRMTAAKRVIDSASGKAEDIAPYRVQGEKPGFRKLTARHQASKNLMRELIDEVNGYRAGVADGDARGLSALVRDLRQDADFIDQAFRQGDLGSAYEILDQRVRSRLGDLVNDTQDSAIRDLAKRLYVRPQKFLEDENVWGELGRRQAQANPSWSDRIAAAQDVNWKSLWATSGTKGADGWGNAKRAQSGAVGGLMRNVGDNAAMSQEMAVRQNMRAMVKDALNRSQAWGSPEAKAIADKMAQKVNNIENAMDAMALAKRDLLAAQAASSVRQLVGAVAGAAAPLAGWGPAAAVRGGSWVANAASRAQGSLSFKVSESATKLLKNVASGAAKAAKYVGPAAGTIPQAKREQIIREAQALQQIGSPETTAMLRQAAEMEKENPALAEAYVNAKLTAAEYLASKLPVAPSTATFAPPAKLDPISARKMERTIAALAHPNQALGRLGEGLASMEDVDVLRTVFPDTYNKFTAAVAERIAKMPKAPGLTERMRIHKLTGIDVDAALERIADLQKLAQATTPGGDGAQVAQSGGKAPSMDAESVYGSRADQIMAGSE